MFHAFKIGALENCFTSILSILSILSSKATPHFLKSGGCTINKTTDPRSKYNGYLLYGKRKALGSFLTGQGVIKTEMELGMISKEELKPYITDYLDEKGINYGRNLKFTCLSPEHTDKHPSMGFNEKDNKVKCFSCDVSLDVFDLVAIDELGANIDYKTYPKPKVTPYDFKTAIAIVASRYAGESLSSSDREQVKAAREEQRKDKLMAEQIEEIRADFKGEIAKTDYLRNRGISDETFERFGFYRADKNALVFDYGNGRVSIRYIEPKDGNRYNKYGKASLFNAQGLNKPEVFITEGEIDALSFLEIGKNAVGLGSVSNKQLLVNAIKDNASTVFYLCLDADESGFEATQTLLASLKDKNVTVFDVREHIYSDQVKDPNEQLTANRDAFIRASESVKDFILSKDNVANDLERFTNKIINSKDYQTTRTGFDRLDDVLGGGFRAGLYVLGAISSLGKTTLLMQVADQIAQSGTDVLVFSLEMSRDELYSKSISRITAQTVLDNAKKYSIRDAKTTLGIIEGTRYEKYSDKEKQLINSAIDQYSEIGKHLYIYEGVGNIGVEQIANKAKMHARITGKPPVIIIDYLQILAPYSEKSTDKQNTDKAVLELKRLSRDLEATVFAISSFNRDNYSKQVNMASFKESGAIEYSSDVLLGLQFTAMDDENSDPTGNNFVETEKAREIRNVTLKVLKNRNGKVGTDAKVDFHYNPMFNMYSEK